MVFDEAGRLVEVKSSSEPHHDHLDGFKADATNLRQLVVDRAARMYFFSFSVGYHSPEAMSLS